MNEMLTFVFPLDIQYVVLQHMVGHWWSYLLYSDDHHCHSDEYDHSLDFDFDSNKQIKTKIKLKKMDC